MKINEIISEALKPSQYRPYVKGWDKSKWSDIFDGKYRLYLPLIDSDPSNVVPNSSVKRTLAKLGMEITDYVSGYAIKKDEPNSRTYRIGKVLADPRFGIDPSVKQKFDQDPSRINPKNTMVVISRHPYDIAGMSTNRGWSSCMNLNQDESNAHYIPLEIKQGTVVAYLIRSDDKNIKRPIARVAIKPFVNIANNKDIAFGVDEVVYGTTSDAFIKTVINWADKVNQSRKLSGVYTLSPQVYRTVNLPDKHIGIDDEELKKQLAQVSNDGMSIQDIKNPSELVQLAAVRENGHAIEFIENPSEKVQMAALKADEDRDDNNKFVNIAANPMASFLNWGKSEIFKAIKNPTPKVIAYAKSQGII